MRSLRDARRLLSSGAASGPERKKTGIGRPPRRRVSSSTLVFRKPVGGPTEILSPVQLPPSPSPMAPRPARRPPFGPDLPDAPSQTELRELRTARKSRPQSPTLAANFLHSPLGFG